MNSRYCQGSNVDVATIDRSLKINQNLSIIPANPYSTLHSALALLHIRVRASRSRTKKWMLELIAIKILFMGKIFFSNKREQWDEVMEIQKFLHVFPFSHSQFTAVNSQPHLSVAAPRAVSSSQREKLRNSEAF